METTNGSGLSCDKTQLGLAGVLVYRGGERLRHCGSETSRLAHYFIDQIIPKTILRMFSPDLRGIYPGNTKRAATGASQAVLVAVTCAPDVIISEFNHENVISDQFSVDGKCL